MYVIEPRSQALGDREKTEPGNEAIMTYIVRLVLHYYSKILTPCLYLHCTLYTVIQVTMTRKQSHVIPESGFHVCEVEGTCKLSLLFILTVILKDQ